GVSTRKSRVARSSVGSSSSVFHVLRAVWATAVWVLNNSTTQNQLNTTTQENRDWYDKRLCMRNSQKRLLFLTGANTLVATNSSKRFGVRLMGTIAISTKV